MGESFFSSGSLVEKCSCTLKNNICPFEASCTWLLVQNISSLAFKIILPLNASK